MQATRMGSAAVIVPDKAKAKHSKVYKILMDEVRVIVVDFYIPKIGNIFSVGNPDSIPFAIFSLLLVFKHTEV